MSGDWLLICGLGLVMITAWALLICGMIRDARRDRAALKRHVQDKYMVELEEDIREERMP